MLRVIRKFSSVRQVRKDTNPFQPRPGPPPLSPADQAEFNRLQKAVREGEKHPYAPAPKQPHSSDFEGPVNPRTGEVNGPKGAEPTRYGDWEKDGRVYDF